MARSYPRIGEISTVRPQGLCYLCNSILLDGKRPNKRIHVQWSIFRGDDEVYKAHEACIKKLSRIELLTFLTAREEK